jgi:hypothetical protein
LRDHADEISRLPGFTVDRLDTDDREFIGGLRRFKPLLYTEGGFRTFQSLAEVERARSRLGALNAMAEAFVESFGGIRQTLSRTFNTATVQYAIHRRFEPTPVNVADLEEWLAGGVNIPAIDVPTAIQPFATKWWNELHAELEPLIGKKIDPRFIASLIVQP